MRPDGTCIHVCFSPSHTCICVVPKNIRPGQVRDEYVMTKARERKVEGTRSRNHSQQSKHNLTYCLCAFKESRSSQAFRVYAALLLSILNTGQPQRNWGGKRFSVQISGFRRERKGSWMWMGCTLSVRRCVCVLVLLSRPIVGECTSEGEEWELGNGW